MRRLTSRFTHCSFTVHLRLSGVFTRVLDFFLTCKKTIWTRNTVKISPVFIIYSVYFRFCLFSKKPTYRNVTPSFNILSLPRIVLQGDESQVVLNSNTLLQSVCPTLTWIIGAIQSDLQFVTRLATYKSSRNADTIHDIVFRIESPLCVYNP